MNIINLTDFTFNFVGPWALSAGSKCKMYTIRHRKSMGNVLCKDSSMISHVDAGGGHVLHVSIYHLPDCQMASPQQQCYRLLTDQQTIF